MRFDLFRRVQVPEVLSWVPHLWRRGRARHLQTVVSMLRPPLAMDDPGALEASFWRCRRQVKMLLVLELVQAELAIGILMVVALCGIVAITHTAVASGAVALPLGLGLAATLSLVFHGLAWRARMSHEQAREELVRLACARRRAAERARYRDGAHPYRAGTFSPDLACAYCVPPS